MSPQGGILVEDDFPTPSEAPLALESS